MQIGAALLLSSLLSSLLIHPPTKQNDHLIYPSRKCKPNPLHNCIRLATRLVDLMSVLALAGGAVGQTYPAIVEYDVIFPRNDTYAPVAAMPVVFAIQNPQAGIPLRLEINWWIYENGRRENPLLNPLDGGFEDPAFVNMSTDPYYIVTSTSQLNSTEGSFSLFWTLSSSNCSENNGTTEPIAFGPLVGSILLRNITAFTMKDGAQQTNLMADPNVCTTNYVAFNITKTLLVDPSNWDGGPVCPLTAELPPPPGNPRAANADEVVASSISSTVTASFLGSACATGPQGQKPLITRRCPPVNKTSLAVRSSFGVLSFADQAWGFG
jgi:hypothetical protein